MAEKADKKMEKGGNFFDHWRVFGCSPTVVLGNKETFLANFKSKKLLKTPLESGTLDRIRTTE